MKNQVFFADQYWELPVFIAALSEVKAAIQNGLLVDADSRFEVMKYENIFNVSFNKSTPCQQS
ncbi:MAG: hypothetical protein WBK51_12435 [Polaromonas sp.]